MLKVILDASTRAKLHNLDDLLELQDESGQVLGHFLPLNHRANGSGLPASPHSDEEIELLRQQKGGRPLAEIWKTLGRTS
jgi:hypothetical protein